MELIPVLSTIILVATITTFILAIGAYILYKRREKRGQKYTPVYRVPATGELITPARSPEYRETETAARRSGRVEEEVLTEKVTLTETPSRGEQRLQAKTTREGKKTTEVKRNGDKFMKYTSEGYISAKENDERGSLKWK